MSGAQFLDELARALAEPMPRRRALQVVSATLVAVAVPGMRPRSARGATTSGSLTCDPDQKLCSFNDPVTRQPLPEYCCPKPWWQFECDENTLRTCRNTCPPWNPALKKNQVPCASAEKMNGRTKNFNCCLRPEQICDPSDVDLCLPNCRLLYPGAGYEQCGNQCCPPGQQCKVVQGQKRCVLCANTCKPPRGRAKCCDRGEKCCFNNTTADCCGPKQTCRAQKRKTATCTCDSGTKCGPDCCKKGEACCGGEECCKPGETCLGSACCPKSRVCGDISCCETGGYCLHKRTGTIFNIPQCVPHCTPGNRAGTQCCGTGYKPNKSKTGCVPE